MTRGGSGRARKVTTAVIGAGHAGLAASRCLSERGLDHVVLERGEVANSWRTERWDSLRLLTPNWQSRLPGYGYHGPDPDGFRAMPETVDFIEHYARVISAPVVTQTKVTGLWQSDTGYLVATDQGDWHARTVVIATGACNTTSVPACASDVPASIQTLTPMQYRHPPQLDRSGVLVVGASATGIQLAQEIHRSGRPVTLSVGEHVRGPRTYRGRDIQWWMDVTGIHDQRYDEVDDIVRARNVPSMQLVGTPERATLDLNALSASGIRLVGRLAGVADGKALFSGSLRNQCTLADLKMTRLLDGIDKWVEQEGIDHTFPPPERLPATIIEDSPPLVLHLAKSNIRTILWATGYRPDYSWLRLPILDRKGRIHHDGGVTELPGVYLMGMQFLRRRKSALIDGAGDDARDLTSHLKRYLDSKD